MFIPELLQDIVGGCVVGVVSKPHQSFMPHPFADQRLVIHVNLTSNDANKFYVHA